MTAVHSWAPFSHAPAGTFDHAEAIDRLGGDDQLLVEIVRLFVDDAPRVLGQINAAIGAGDAGRVSAAAHELKGAAATLSAAGVAEAASALEQSGRQREFEHMRPAWRLLQGEMQDLQAALNQFLTDASPCAS